MWLSKIHRVFRNATYEISIKNCKPNGKMSIAIDDEIFDGNILPDFNDGKVHNVKVEII